MTGALLADIAAAFDHRRDDTGTPVVCAHCHQVWPCTTARHLERRLLPVIDAHIGRLEAALQRVGALAVTWESWAQQQGGGILPAGVAADELRDALRGPA